jgi:Sec7-like guanine-nucleotide exchange factor
MCYSIIMLSTDQHNANVKEKMSVDQFVQSNK